MPLGVMLYVIILNVVKTGFKLSEGSSNALALCVTILALLGIVNCMDNSIQMMLLPYYGSLAVLIITVMLIKLITSSDDSTKHFSHHTPKKTSIQDSDTVRKNKDNSKQIKK